VARLPLAVKNHIVADVRFWIYELYKRMFGDGNVQPNKYVQIYTIYQE